MQEAKEGVDFDIKIQEKSKISQQKKQFLA